jgi:hypothetical protein
MRVHAIFFWSVLSTSAPKKAEKNFAARTLIVKTAPSVERSPDCSTVGR